LLQKGFFALSRQSLEFFSKMAAEFTFWRELIRSAVAWNGLGKGGYGATREGGVYLTFKASKIIGVMWAADSRIRGMP
jgi:hypothetical protein